MNERLFAIVSGRVQMVMFRDFVQRKASGLRLVGEVRNLKDGTVEVIVEGERAKLEKLLGKLHEGPLLARVEHVSVSWLPATGEFSNFRIAYE
ncbi:MAG: acyP [Parcubacteria group bacterium]|nr:acyP [Parcubacteria group bacterium]